MATFPEMEYLLFEKLKSSYQKWRWWPWSYLLYFLVGWINRDFQYYTGCSLLWSAMETIALHLFFGMIPLLLLLHPTRDHSRVCPASVGRLVGRSCQPSPGTGWLPSPGRPGLPAAAGLLPSVDIWWWHRRGILPGHLTWSASFRRIVSGTGRHRKIRNPNEKTRQPLFIMSTVYNIQKTKWLEIVRLPIPVHSAL